MAPNHLAAIFSDVQSKPPKPFLVDVVSCFVAGQYRKEFASIVFVMHLQLQLLLDYP